MEMSPWRQHVCSCFFPEGIDAAEVEQRSKEMLEVHQRYEKAKKLYDEGQISELQSSEILICESVPIAAKAIHDYVSYKFETGGQKRARFPHLRMMVDLPPEVCALIGLRIIFSTIGREGGYQDIAVKIGDTCWYEEQFIRWCKRYDEERKERRIEGGDPGNQMIAKKYFAKVYPNAGYRALADWLKEARKRGLIVAKQEWNNRKERRRLGFAIAKVIIDALPRLFFEQRFYMHGKSYVVPQFLSSVEKDMLNARYNPSWIWAPLQQPMLCPPRDWRINAWEGKKN